MIIEMALVIPFRTGTKKNVQSNTFITLYTLTEKQIIIPVTDAEVQTVNDKTIIRGISNDTTKRGKVLHFRGRRD